MGIADTVAEVLGGSAPLTKASSVKGLSDIIEKALSGGSLVEQIPGQVERTVDKSTPPEKSSLMNDPTCRGAAALGETALTLGTGAVAAPSEAVAGRSLGIGPV